MVICLSANIVKTALINNNQENKPLMLVLFSSPRKNGYTKKLLESFLMVAENKYDIKILDCYKLMPKPCIHCGKCEKADVCIFNDLDEYDALLSEAEALVFASPVYNLSVPAPLKALVDRSQRYFSKRFSLGIKPPIKKHKKAVLLLTCGSNDESGFEIIEKQLSRMFTIINTELFGKICVAETDRIKDIAEYEKQAYELAKNLADTIN